MRQRILRLFVATTLLTLTPAVASAQQMPVPADGESMNQPPAAGVQGAADLCGKTPAEAFGPTTTDDGLPVEPTLNPKDTGLERTELSRVTGTVTHAEGNLILVSLPSTPATGGPLTGSRAWAVVQLPAGCNQLPQAGTDITAIGKAMPSGILMADLVTAAG